MFVDLPAGIHCDNVENLRIAVHGKQDAPTTKAGLAHAGALGKRSREARIEGIFLSYRRGMWDCFEGDVGDQS